MDNIKKLGLTALAGSMVATAAHSAELSASGSWALSYTSEDDDAVNGQAFTMGDRCCLSREKNIFGCMY